MWANIFHILMETMKSSVVQNIITALVGSAVTAEGTRHDEVSSVVQAAADATHPAIVANSVANAIIPGLSTWSAAELDEAAKEWVSAKRATALFLPSPEAVFEAGVAWALAHQTTTLIQGLAAAMAGAHGAPAAIPAAMAAEASHTGAEPVTAVPVKAPS
jgi:hypothetical protein